MRGCSSHYHETLDLTDSVDTNLIDPPKSPLRNYKEGIEEIVSSIKEKGLIQPIIVRPVGNRFEVVAGARRLEACKRLRWSRVPCIVRDISEKDAFEISLTENVQRKTMNPIEEARAFKQYVDKYGWGGESELAKRIGKSQEYVSQRLSLLKLPPRAQEKIIRRLISPGIASEIARIKDTKTQADLIDHVLKHKLTVGIVRDTAKAIKKGEQIFSQIPGSAQNFERQGNVHTDEDSDERDEPEFMRLSHYNAMKDETADAVKDLEKATLILKLALSRLGTLIDEMPDESPVKDLLLEKRLAVHNMIDSLIKAKIKISGRLPLDGPVTKIKFGR
jgi:ParB family chromosome partitioning protein